MGYQPMTRTFYDRCCLDCRNSHECAGVLQSLKRDYTPVVDGETCQSCNGNLVDGEIYRVEVEL